jgi:hypothetical protein
LIDDHKYSVGRSVVYRISSNSPRPRKLVGRILEVRLVNEPQEHWEYVIRNPRSRRTVSVPEDDILFGTLADRRGSRDLELPLDVSAEEHPSDLIRLVTKLALTEYLETTIRDLINREESEAYARDRGRDLPLEPGDYIRVRGNLRRETERCHNHYAKVLEVVDPDVSAIESSRGENHKVVRKYKILLEDGTTTYIYDPEVKLYYTAGARTTILNWKAAIFLAESFGDAPPYSVEYSFLEDHIFTRKELEELSAEQLARILASLLYVKGHMGLRDYEKKDRFLDNLPREYLIDSILSTSRFDMRRNRKMTPEEVQEKLCEMRRLKQLLHD